MSMNRAKTVTIVVPFLNERENLPVLAERVAGVFAQRAEAWELLLVDDGSVDGSGEWAVEQARRDPRVRVLRLSRNFGHQLAITAGLDRATGDAVVVMDADLQDPPETIAAMVDKWREGYEVVYAIRRSRAGETWLKKFLAATFYRVFRRLAKVDVPMDAGDFRLVDRCVVDALKEMRELHRFMRGLTCWVGFRQGAVEYDRAARNAGETKYPVWKSARLAFDAITSFSASPLRWIAVLGVAVCGAGVLWVVHVAVQALRHPGSMQRGWASLIAVMVVLGGLQLVGIGMLGQYVSRIFEEGKRRPLYLVRLDTADGGGKSGRTRGTDGGGN
jgi:polyisoprenyl-phosphate glycosyltransferase